MKKNLIVRQDGYKECGVACLLSIIRYYGGNISINKLLEYTHTDKNGTSFYNLKLAASKFCIETEAFKINNSKEDLSKIITPSICQVIDNNFEHFVVLYKVTKKNVVIMDPARGEKKMSISNFLGMWTGYVMSFVKTKPIPYIENNNYLSLIIKRTLIKNKSIVLNIVLLSIFLTFVSSLYAMYGGIVIDRILSISRNNLLVLTLLFLIMLIIKSLTNFFRNKLLIYLNQKFDCSVFLTAFFKILLLPYSYYKNRTTGEVITRVNDLQYIKNMISKIVLTLFLDLVISVTCAIILLKINVLMFILLVITILIYILIFIIFKPFIKKYTNISQENNAKINSEMIEMINGYETIKNLNLESVMNEKMTSLYVKSLNDMYAYDNVSNLEFFLKDLVSFLSILIVEFTGFNLVLDGTLTTGQIIIFSGLLTYFITPIRNIIDLSKEYYFALNSLKRANNLLDIESVNLDEKTKFVINGNILFNNLVFSYNDYKLVLEDINLVINNGEKILILGDSGSGKSTILKLLLKYYSIGRDKLYLDGIDINDISISNLRRYITIISQNEKLFSDTIKNNILLNRNINEVDFVNICKLVYVDDIVKNMFLGYDTKLEENGVNISGGQKQRIVLARALLKGGNIILIDEALNSVDINMERKILKNIFELYRDKTIVIVSHRIENIDLYDGVIEFDHGKVKSFNRKFKGANYNV